MTAAVVSVAACGGSGDDGAVGGGTGPAPSTTSIPASALASVEGLVAFMSQLIDAGADDTSEPIVLGDASLPADDSM